MLWDLNVGSSSKWPWILILLPSTHSCFHLIMFSVYSHPFCLSTRVSVDLWESGCSLFGCLWILMVHWIMWTCFKKKSKLESYDQLFQGGNYGPLNPTVPCCSHTVLEKERFLKYFHSKTSRPFFQPMQEELHFHNPNQPMTIVEFLTSLILLIHEPVTCLSHSLLLCDVNIFWFGWDTYYKLFLLNIDPDFFYGDKLCHDLSSSNRPILEVQLLSLPWAARSLGLRDHAVPHHSQPQELCGTCFSYNLGGVCCLSLTATDNLNEGESN